MRKDSTHLHVTLLGCNAGLISVTTMVLWMHSLKALRATLTFGSYFCVSKNWSAMALTGLGFLGSLLRAIVQMTQPELDECLAVSWKVQSATDVCVHLLVRNFRILWAQLDLDKWGWMMCFAPTPCEKKRDVLLKSFLVRCFRMVHNFVVSA